MHSSSSCYLFLGREYTRATTNRSRRTRTQIIVATLLIFGGLFALTSCQTLRHQLTEPTPDWESRTGQLQYRGPKTSLIGEVLMRYSKRGDFELTFSKGPSVLLLTVRQNDRFVRVSGPLARGSWSGPPNEAPPRLRGWVALRRLLLGSPDKPFLRATIGPETFTFAF
jgi:hypothetical protein